AGGRWVARRLPPLRRAGRADLTLRNGRAAPRAARPEPDACPDGELRRAAARRPLLCRLDLRRRPLRPGLPGDPDAPPLPARLPRLRAPGAPPDAPAERTGGAGLTGAAE